MPFRKLVLSSIALMTLAGALPVTGAPDVRGKCLNTCKQQYEFCLKASTTKAARKTCVVSRKNCKSGCKITH